MKADYHTDIAIVGAGPAGMAAAIAAAEQGKHVSLIDDNPAPGGQIWRQGGAPLRGAARASLRSLAASRVRLISGSRVVATPEPGLLLLESARQASSLRYDKLIVCTGARERLLPFPGWTLPGVTGAGGLQALVKSGLNPVGQRVVLAGSGPLLLATAQTLQQAGAQVLLIAEQADLRQLARFAWGLRAYPAKLRQAAGLAWQLRSIPYWAGSHVIEAQGKDRLEGVRLKLAGEVRHIACDWLGVGFGLLPNTELLAALGCRLEDGHACVDAAQQTSNPMVYTAGESTGVGGVDKAVLEGRIAGLAASGALAHALALSPRRASHLRFAELLATHFALRPEIAQAVRPDTLVCRCEDVSHARLSAFDNWREAKLQTRCGMGPCQGRICGAACQTLYGWQTAAGRPPISPARLATLLHTYPHTNQTEADLI
ncbi:NAD(P)/FAD-dependent oxidoreductase [Chitinimonas arctica]|uniref:NAD(P)/FAD-dependent oxidoreductase n=1 Tax=Chitinimonas arctica TaxID=2594795 RepID=A0A516SES4_9NEIS|nr:FAD/NAD(P)-binding oxidoreductase [Chitinimonas arctica]QDQ26528.1 NAD(P)/FAD-dependent oxidoreductase [Chitinimonas arctica]